MRGSHSPSPASQAKEQISSFSQRQNRGSGRAPPTEPGLGGAPLAERATQERLPQKRSQRTEAQNSETRRTANYGRLGPAGALRYCRSVSIDFEEEPSTQETEQREQALLQKLGFYDDRIEAKMRSDTEFHRIVGAQTKTNGTERKMTRESFLMAARQLWGLDHVQAAAAFASADLTGEDTLNKREYLLLREAFHHRDARPCPSSIACAGPRYGTNTTGRGPKGLTREDYRDFVADLCAGDTHVDHVMRVLEQHRESKNRPRLIPDAMCGEQGLSEEDFLSDLLDQDLLGPRGLEKRDLLMGFSGDSPQRRRRHRWRASDARAEADGGQANRPTGIARGSRGLRPGRRNKSDRSTSRVDERKAARACRGRRSRGRCIPEAVNADLELAAPLACEFDWRGPGAAQRDSELFDVAMGCVDRAGAMARSCLNAPEDELDRTWLCDPPDAALALLLDATDPSVLARRVVELAQACKRIAAAQPPW